MKENFEQELLMDCLDQIVGMRKERTMLLAKEQGLLGQVAQMMNRAISRFEDQGLIARSSHGEVRYWLVKAEARVCPHTPDEIETVLGFACSPFEIKGHSKLTKEEQKLVNELQRIWKSNTRFDTFLDPQKYMMLSEKLSVLPHQLQCYREIHYYFGMDDFGRGADLLSTHFDLSRLGDQPQATTRDLVTITELFDKNI